MKVDEKMIEATMLTDEAAFQLGNHVIGLCGVTKSRRAGVTELGRQVYRAVMLSAAPTDYGEMVERLREVVDDAGIRITNSQERTILEAADAIELLSAPSGDGVNPVSRA